MTTTWPPHREELVSRLRAGTRLFAVLLVAAVLPQFVALPWRLAGLVFALGAVGVGVRLLFVLAAFRRRGGRGGGFLGIAVGLAVAAATVVDLGLQAAFYPIAKDRQDCLARASTLHAERLCNEEAERRLENLLGPAARTSPGLGG